VQPHITRNSIELYKKGWLHKFDKVNVGNVFHGDGVSNEQLERRQNVFKKHDDARVHDTHLPSNLTTDSMRDGTIQMAEVM
jgi:hypothetical protein